MFAAILLLAGIITCALAYFDVLTGRYDRARDKASADFKPRPLRVSEIGEPPHGSLSDSERRARS